MEPGPLEALTGVSLLSPFCLVTAALFSLLRCYYAFGPERHGDFIPGDSGHQTLIVYNEESKASSAQVVMVEQGVAWQCCQQACIH